MTFETVAVNLRESFRVIAASRSVGELRELPGVSLASAGTTFQMFNAAFLSAPVESDVELARRVVLPSVHFDARGLSWAYWVCEDLLGWRAQRKCRQVFERQGLRHSVDLPGMIAERVLPPQGPLPEIEVRRVSDPGGSEGFCSVGSVCFHVPTQWFREVFDGARVWDRFRAYNGYVDGEVVSTAAIVAGGDAIGVYNVATLPEHQRRGYGEAVMRFALNEAERDLGIHRSILQSTPAGIHLYQRMGYRTVTRISVYVS
ncbi:MAG: GNAT family N-acetyltransferase [Bryobacteraceae bacterium]